MSIPPGTQRAFQNTTRVFRQPLTPNDTGWIVLSLVMLVAWPYESSLQSSQPPPGFSLVATARGVELFRKVDRGGNPIFVQVVDLAQGASVKLLHGNIIDPGIGQGVYGGNNPEMVRETLQEVWNKFSTSNPNAFCLTNGQFFSANDDPTRLAFPLKKDGKIISDGYALSSYPNQKLILEIWNGRADMTPLTRHTLYSSSAPNMIAGLTEDAGTRPNKPKKSVGRTFVGIDDKNTDGRYEVVLIFTATFAKKAEAASVLRRFGADKVMMLDGGGSTQLLCQNTAYIPSSRPIPQAIAVAGSAAPAVSAIAVRQWP